MDAEKFDFIKNQFVPLVKTLSADTAGNWGKMNGQQMVEHVAAFSGGIGRERFHQRNELVFDEVEFFGVHSDRLYAK